MNLVMYLNHNLISVPIGEQIIEFKFIKKKEKERGTRQGRRKGGRRQMANRKMKPREKVRDRR